MAAKLPSAPLAEVVFELRWALQGDPNLPVQLHSDPGYHVFADVFARKVMSDGFPFQREKPGTDPHMVIGSIIRAQFMEAEDNPFPMFQIGPGVFASNDATDYDWTKFKKRTLRGVAHLLGSYPKMSNFSFRPVHLELRYTNSFDPDLIGHRDILKFVNNNTSISIDVPNLVIGSKCESVKDGNITLEFPLRNLKDSVFAFQIVTGSIAGNATILLISRVVSKSQELRIGQSARFSSRAIDRWLEDAHSITSPFFRSIIDRKLMSKFRKRAAKKR